MSTTLPSSIVCPECGRDFPYRSNKKFCSASCRKASSQRERRQRLPANAANSRTIRRDQHEIFDLAMRMAERLYSMSPFARFGYLEEIIQVARNGQCPKTRKILTMPALIRPNPNNKHLFYRRCPSFCTISQAADIYCRVSPWNAGVAKVVRGEVPEPPTGEIIGAEVSQSDEPGWFEGRISERLTNRQSVRFSPHTPPLQRYKEAA